MGSDALNNPEVGTEEHEIVADQVTAEFVAGMQDPNTSPNGVGADLEDPLEEHPEVLLGAAFAGGFVLGRLVRRLGS